MSFPSTDNEHPYWLRKDNFFRRFVIFRPNPPEGYLEAGRANNPEEIQLEGVVFSDGTCVVRWLTPCPSHSVWASFEHFDKVHGHPEYGTIIKWLDE